eukprot:1363889-Amorphochlora_amoeboformis.AAC.1
MLHEAGNACEDHRPKAILHVVAIETLAERVEVSLGLREKDKVEERCYIQFRLPTPILLTSQPASRSSWVSPSNIRSDRANKKYRLEPTVAFPHHHKTRLRTVPAAFPTRHVLIPGFPGNALLSTASQRNLRMTQQDNVATGFILVTAAGLATALGAGLVYSPWFVKVEFCSKVHALSKMIGMSTCNFHQIANKKFLAGSLGLAAGVMMFVSFIEIFFKSNDAFVEHGFKENVAFSLATALFFAGIVFIQLLDLVVHSISDYEKDLHEVCDVVLEKGFEKNVPGNANKTTSPTRPSTAIEEIKREVKDRESQMQGSIADVAPRASTGTTFELTKRGSDVENMSTSESTLDKDPHRVRLNRMGLMTALAIGIHNFPEGLATFLGTLDDP